MTLAILFPKTRAEVLRLLFEDPARESHLRDLARGAGLSPAALQRELTSLAGSGLVLSRRDGNRLYFKANTAHPWYADLHGLVSKTTGIVPALRNALAPLEGIDFAFIFGSIAAGHASASSDVDLLILGSIGLRKLTPALRCLPQTFSRGLNPYCMTTEEWRRKRRENDAFTARVTREPKLWLKGDADVFGAMGF